DHKAGKYQVSHGGLLRLFLLVVVEAQNLFLTLSPQSAGRNKGRFPVCESFRQAGFSRVVIIAACSHSGNCLCQG
ncbi:MAG: hypothetical protein VYD68_05290, partial [Pseudomonadota bacterium]|nr:hypothetical protein [Pseudomonadota bacterium]